MLRTIAIGFLFLAVVGGSDPAQAGQDDAGVYPGTCAYFGNRTGGQRQGERADWLALLAQSCSEALRRLGSGSEDAADRDYLDRLTTLRQVVVGMNVARFTGPGSGGPGLRIRRSVTDSGEYLIARRIGVMEAFSAWAEIADFRMAAMAD